MSSNEDNLINVNSILTNDEGILETYKNPIDGKEFTVLGELVPDTTNEQVKRFKGIIRWSNKIPLLKQVGTLKKICPTINSIPNSELLKDIKGTLEWEFGNFLPEEAEDLLSKAKQNELNISMIELK